MISRHNDFHNLRICVLQPDYSGTGIDLGNYDPRRDLSGYLPEALIDHVFLKKTTVYSQLRQASDRGFDIFVNLCEGYLDWEIPSIDVIWFLDRLGLPYTGSPANLYDPTKEVMKYVACVQGVGTPKYTEVFDADHIELKDLLFPLFVKPGHSGDSLGIDSDSLVTEYESLDKKCRSVINGFGSAIIEEYIDGREFTVLVAANPQDRNNPVAYRPMEFVFPEGERFKTYDLKIKQHHPECNISVQDPELDRKLREAAKLIFTGFQGQGYARLDFRMDAASNLFFLDVNFACSVFYDSGAEGSADYILRHDEAGHSGFLKHIIQEGIERHRRRRRLWVRKNRSTRGFGIFAAEDIREGEVIFPGEERHIRLVTRGHIERNWNSKERETAQHYAIPYSSQILAIWDDDPENWAPQNHSCNPNTCYHGLDVIALGNIQKGEELTLDYSEICDENLPPFECDCGQTCCRGTVSGTPGISLTETLEKKRQQARDVTEKASSEKRK